MTLSRSIYQVIPKVVAFLPLTTEDALLVRVLFER